MNLKTSPSAFFQNSMAILLFLVSAITLRAATVWTGPPMSFSKGAFADWTLPENQDRMTLNVWITRADSHGIFNIKTESGFAAFASPADTAWATGELANYASLTYSDWETWTGRSPPSTVGQNAVVHLISDDIYLSLQFTSWVSAAAGGGFSYIRSTPGAGPPPPPAPTLTGAALAPDGTFSFAFTNVPGNTFSVLVTTNVSLALTNWTVVGSVTDAPAGSGRYKFVDAGAGTNSDERHYIVRWP